MLQTRARTAEEQAEMLVGQKGRAASLLLGSLRLATLLVKLHLWQFFSKESNMQLSGLQPLGVSRLAELEYFQT